MTESEIDKVIAELPDLPRNSGWVYAGTHCYPYKDQKESFVPRFEVLLYTGELVECSSFIYHGNDTYKESLRRRLEQGSISLGAGVCHREILV